MSRNLVVMLICGLYILASEVIGFIMIHQLVKYKRDEEYAKTKPALWYEYRKMDMLMFVSLIWLPSYIMYIVCMLWKKLMQ